MVLTDSDEEKEESAVLHQDGDARFQPTADDVALFEGTLAEASPLRKDSKLTAPMAVSRLTLTGSFEARDVSIPASISGPVK